MIRFDEPVADAYVTGGRNVMLPSSPGRQVRFMAGHAVIKDGRDMVAMMRLSMVKLVLTPHAMSWLPTWISEARTVRAEILRPEPPPEPEPDPEKPLANWDPDLRPGGTDSPQPDP